MTKQSFTPAYPAELRERGIRLFRDNRTDHASDTAAYKARCAEVKTVHGREGRQTREVRAEKLRELREIEHYIKGVGPAP